MTWNQHLQNMNPPQCECHECTQARWKSSFAGQFDASFPKKPQHLWTKEESEKVAREQHEAWIAAEEKGIKP